MEIEPKVEGDTTDDTSESEFVPAVLDGYELPTLAVKQEVKEKEIGYHRPASKVEQDDAFPGAAASLIVLPARSKEMI